METSIYYPVVTKREEELPFYITTIGVSTDETMVYRMGGLESYQLLYSQKGCGRAVLYDEVFEVPEGTLLCLPPNTPHNYYKTSGIWRTLWITFSGWAAEQFFNVDAGIVHVPKEFDFEERFEEIRRNKNAGEWVYKSSVLLYSLLLGCRELVSEELMPVYKMRSRLTKCMKYIGDSYGRELELAELAGICGVSEEHFCRIFKSYTGMRPFEYITRLRIQKAKVYLMKSKSTKISDVARETGFSSASYFSAVFKKHVGQTPEEYRSISRAYTY